MDSFEKKALCVFLVVVAMIGTMVVVCYQAESQACERHFPNDPKLACIFSDKYRVIAH
jgi:hypothetical protein